MISKTANTHSLSTSHPEETPPNHSEFVKMIPFIERRARFCFRDLDYGALEETVEETRSDFGFSSHCNLNTQPKRF